MYSKMGKICGDGWKIKNDLIEALEGVRLYTYF